MNFKINFAEPGQKARLFVFIGGLLVIAWGILLRLYHITQNDFIFYDEGYYLNYNREIMQIISRYEPKSFGDWTQSFVAYLKASLAGAKALWFLVVNARVYLAGHEAWFFPRVVSALAGITTLFMTFQFARRYFASRRVAWLATVLLAILPSHVFYSRLGLQEALSTLLVLSGFYFYVFSPRLNGRTFLSGVLLAAAFFSNYRLIILPVLIVFVETWQAVVSRAPWQSRKVVWAILTFFSCVFLIGNLDGGKNTVITFGWMFHQANLAQRGFDPLNLFSFPYYVFRLENMIFGLLFFGNIYFIATRRREKALPFVLVCLQMLIFSFASEKGARYICVMTPFMVMAVAGMVDELLDTRQAMQRIITAVIVALMVGVMGYKSTRLAQFRSDYRPSAEYLLSFDPAVKFLSTQNYVQNLYVPQANRAEACPHRFEDLVSLYSRGHRYLILCPQTYISWTENEERFNPKLKGYLGFVSASVKPIKIYPHFNELILERFVFDHNENLFRSIRFLQDARRQGYGQIRIYYLPETINQILVVLSNKK